MTVSIVRVLSVLPRLCAPQEQAASLVKALAQYTITLQDLENSLLARLANAQVRHGWGRPRLT
jgi:hypothetical protein